MLNATHHFTFFMVVQPGLEDLAYRELNLKVRHQLLEPLQSCRVVKGGLEIETTLENAHLINQFAKIPTRNYLRISEFKARDFPRLFNKSKKLKWYDYFYHPDVTIKVTSHRSRLIHTERIEKCLKDAITSAFKARPPSKKSLAKKNELTLMCRIDNDLVTLSLELTADPLYKRSPGKRGARAPLRENLAAALSFFTWLSLNENERNGLTLIDPFCGSGTIVHEGLNFYLPFERTSPFFAQTQTELRTVSPPPLYHFGLGFDIDPQMIQLARTQFSSRKNRRFYRSDVDQLKGRLSERIIISNPPYNKRIKTPIHQSQKWFELMESSIAWKRLGLLLPQEQKLKPKNSQCHSQLNFTHGGLNVTYSLFSSQASPSRSAN